MPEKTPAPTLAPAVLLANALHQFRIAALNLKGFVRQRDQLHARSAELRQSLPMHPMLLPDDGFRAEYLKQKASIDRSIQSNEVGLLTAASVAGSAMAEVIATMFTSGIRVDGDNPPEGWRHRVGSDLREIQRRLAIPAAGERYDPPTWSNADEAAYRVADDRLCDDVRYLRVMASTDSDTPASKPANVYDETDGLILRALSEAGRALPYVDLATNAGRSEGTCKARVQQLLAAGLINRKGERGGFTINATGIAVLEPMRASLTAAR